MDGDKSIKFFHNTIKLRYATNKITRLRHDHIFLEYDIELDSHVINFYIKL